MAKLPDFTSFLAETSRVSILITDAQGYIVWANAGFQRISGHALSATRGRRPGELLQGRDTDPATVEFMSTRLKAGMGFEAEVLNYDAGGRDYWVSLEVTPVRDESGTLTHFIGIQHDITHLRQPALETELRTIRAELRQISSERTRHLVESNRKLEAEIGKRSEVEAELRRSRSFLQSALDALSAHVAILDEQGTIVAVNQAWKDFASDNGGAGVPDSLGINYLTVCENAARSSGAPEASLMHRGISEVLCRKRQNFYLEYPCHGPNNERWFQARVSRFSVDGTDRLVIAHENITETKMAERRLREHFERLGHVQRLETMGEMSAALAHELNQPLAAISNYTSGTLRRLRGSNTVAPDVLEAMELALAEANRAAEIIRRMRRFSRNAEIQREPANIREIVEDTIALVAGDALRRDVRVVTRHGEEIPPVLADSIHLQQVLINLIRNGAEAMSGDLPPERRVIEVSTSAPTSDTVEVRVTDHGCGLTKETMDHLFDPFVTTKPNGMGLGLAICRSIIDAHGGRIWAETNTDERTRDVLGSTFGFIIPAAPRIRSHSPVQDSVQNK